MKNSHKFALAAFVVLVGVLVLPLHSLFGHKDSKDVTVLTSSNTLILNTEVAGPQASELIQKAQTLQGQTTLTTKPIYLFLNTPGGEVQTGLELIEALNGLKRPVNTVTLFAASMGFQIVQNLGERLILQNGTLMSHRAQGAFQGFFGGKTGSQLDSRYGFWLSKLMELDLQTVKRTNGKQTLESYQKAYADELWLTGQQAVNGGYADRIVKLRCDDSLNGSTTHEAEFLGLKILYDIDNCPINTNPMNLRIVVPENKKIDTNFASDVKARFTEQYIEKQRQVVPMTR